MDSSLVSRFFRNPLGFTLSAMMASSVYVGPAALAADGPVSHSRAPAWGTDHSSVLTLTAADFHSDDAQEAYVAPGGFQVCVSPPIFFQSCKFLAGVPLPSGALIEYMEFAVCDPDSTVGATADLYAWEGFESGPAVASIATQGDGGCSLWTSGYVGVTVDNLSNIYQVAVELPSGQAVRFRAVRIFYSLQVSPAPGFATFNDVPTTHPLFQYVEAIYASGITAGCGNGNYCPGAALTRGQMAVFLARALGLYFPN